MNVANDNSFTAWINQIQKEEYEKGGIGHLFTPSPIIFWEYILADVQSDGEFITDTRAIADAQEKFAEQCVDLGARNGDIFDETITLIKFKIDDNGKNVELERREGIVEYEHYHGDFKEHATY